MKLKLTSNMGQTIEIAEAVEFYALQNPKTQAMMWDRIDREIQGLIENNPDERPSKSYSQDRTMAISGVLRKPKKKK